MTQHSLPVTNVNRWFPSNYNRGPNALVWVALTAVFLATFIKIWTPTSVNRWPEAIATLLFIYPLIKNWQFFKNQWLIKLMGLAIVSPILFFGINYLIDAELAVKYAHFEPLARIYLFIPIAWWLGGSLRTISIFLIIALAGFFYACLQDPNFMQTIQRIIAGGRVDFGILNAQHVALFFSVSLIGLISFLPIVIALRNKKLSCTLTVVLTLAALLCIIGLFGTQTRAAILALAIAVSIFTVKSVINIVKRNATIFNKKTVLVIILTFVTAAFGSFFLQDKLEQTIGKRITSESSTMQSILKKDWENIPYSNIGTRVNTWILALDLIKMKPIIGYGANIRLYAIKNSNLPDNVRQRIGHFHNSFIEFTLGFGLLGLALAVAPFITVLTYSKKVAPPIKNFAIYSLITFTIMNLFESYLFFWMGPFLCIIMCAPVFSQYIERVIHLPSNIEEKQHV